METIAVYWEAKIRTYGFHLFEDLGLHQFDLAADELASWSGVLQSVTADEAGFRLVWCQCEVPGPITFFLVCSENAWRGLQPLHPSGMPVEAAAPQGMGTAADVICFHGPHFGDRYGIMDFTYRALAAGAVPLLGVVCSVASIYLVVPAGWGGQAQALLTAAFEIPKSVKE
jgi:hypothetical protein